MRTCAARDRTAQAAHRLSDGLGSRVLVEAPVELREMFEDGVQLFLVPLVVLPRRGADWKRVATARIEPRERLHGFRPAAARYHVRSESTDTKSERPSAARKNTTARMAPHRFGTAPATAASTYIQSWAAVANRASFCADVCRRVGRWNDGGSSSSGNGDVVVGSAIRHSPPGPAD